MENNKRTRERIFITSGQRFGRLTTVHRLDSYKGAFWLCICDCGTRVEARQYALKYGRHASCGCSRNSANGESGIFNLIVRSYRKNARSRNIPFSLDISELKVLFSGRCWYCGIPPSNVMKAKKLTLRYSGIDRLDNSIGYVTGNCVSCCKLDNMLKQKRSSKEYIDHCIKVAKHFAQSLQS